MNRQLQIDRFLIAAHRLALSRLREQPDRMAAVRALLARWRKASGVTRSDAYWDEWERLLALSIDELEQSTCADTERANCLRNVLPMGVLLSQSERARLLREAQSA